MTIAEACTLLSFDAEMEMLRLEAKLVGVTDDEWRDALALQYEEWKADRISLEVLPDRMRQFISAMRSPRSSGQS